MSRLWANPRCTPPVPPVPMKRMPVARHTARVPPTVVAPSAPCTTQAARSRAPTLRADSPADANRSRSAPVRPTRTAPSITPTVAGTAPAARTRASEAWATSSPWRPGKPWETSVVSSATTGPPSRSAAATSSASTGVNVIAWLPSPRRIRPVTGLAAARRSRHRPHPGDGAGGRVQPEADPAEQVARRERVARAGRVHRVHLARGVDDPADPDPARSQLHHHLATGHLPHQVRLFLGAEYEPWPQPGQQRAEAVHAIVSQRRR